MNETLRKLHGMVCHVDGILVTGRNKKEHDTHLHVVLKKLEAAGITLNKDKYKFFCNKIVFLGHVINANGISADPAKIEVIKKMRAPQMCQS